MSMTHREHPSISSLLLACYWGGATGARSRRREDDGDAGDGGGGANGTAAAVFTRGDFGLFSCQVTPPPTPPAPPIPGCRITLNGMEWIGTEWNGMERNGTEQHETEWKMAWSEEWINSPPDASRHHHETARRGRHGETNQTCAATFSGRPFPSDHLSTGRGSEQPCLRIWAGMGKQHAGTDGVEK